MSFELKLLISLLKMTNENVVLIEQLNKDARIPNAATLDLLQKLQNENLIYLGSNHVEVDSSCRLKIAVKAISLGADIERITNLLCWQEFEEITALTLENYGYAVQKNLRFKYGGRKWEIDVVGFKKPLVVCFDCKHWAHAIASSVLSRIVIEQVNRTASLVDSLPNIKLKLPCTQWEKAEFIPAVLSLIQNVHNYVNEVPVVPVLKLQDFISQLPLHTNQVRSYSKVFTSLSHRF